MWSGASGYAGNTRRASSARASRVANRHWFGCDGAVNEPPCRCTRVRLNVPSGGVRTYAGKPMSRVVTCQSLAKRNGGSVFSRRLRAASSAALASTSVTAGVWKNRRMTWVSRWWRRLGGTRSR